MHDIRPYLPRLFSDPGTLLYVGCRPDASSWLTELWAARHTISVMEAFANNCIGLRGDDRIRWIYHLDVRQIDEEAMLPPGTFPVDVIFWWHGPEHIPYDEIAPTLQKLEHRTRRLVCLASPWGVYPQGAHAGNPYEVHQCSLYPSDFEGWGYEVRTDGGESAAGSEIVAWKWVGDE